MADDTATPAHVGPTVRTTADAAEFLARADGWLAANPVTTNFLCTAAGAVTRGAFVPDAPWYATVERAGRVVGGAVHLRSVVLVGPDDGPGGAGALLAEALLDAGRTPTGVSGPTRTAEGFARRWEHRTGAAFEVAIAEGVHVLTTLRPPVGVAGAARPAAEDDVPLVAAWMDAFAAEALPHLPAAHGESTRMVAGAVAERRLVLWEDGGPVSLAGVHRPVHGIGRVGPVWTPPEHRRHGYAAAVTAAATQRLLEGGAATCILFTDLANATSNGVYARIGYERVGDAVEYAFCPA
jgi:RimJ/RimL family protein N-acetyltransferase